MGENTPKSVRDREYRELAARLLESIMDRREMNIGDLADALGVDRSVASRYLSRKVRPPLQRLQRLERSINETVPTEVVEAFWVSESGKPAVVDVVDIETAIRDIGNRFTEHADDAAKARARRQLEDLLKKLA